MDPKPRAQALEALSAVRAMLASPEPLVGVRLVQVRGLLEYAEAQVTAIEETKRPRKKTESTT